MCFILQGVPAQARFAFSSLAAASVGSGGFWRIRRLWRFEFARMVHLIIRNPYQSARGFIISTSANGGVKLHAAATSIKPSNHQAIRQ
ncbi:hypothetical protein F4827_004482 [Paraburkholderia bannensis]|uniref:Uncharacterized protein n=1 Tax=Paraburkholderia bannensis TaxID=765414 RepID=A0A7W9WV93_9BURK|nr:MULTISPECIES: hypothetical protein [Paraburkholderia]MBB3259607.1 hypothetical protein [Paraburkholderia sp. WP4_3_2]MBB6104623.1 hypothetical protein [Paraburkholderia bannensis]